MDNLWPHVRIVAANRGLRRAAHGTQVVVVGYRRAGEGPREMVSLGSPVLGWPSAGAPNDALTIFPGMHRPVDLGSLYPARRDDSGRFVLREVYTQGLSVALAPGIQPPAVVMPADGGQWQFRLGLGSGLAIADYREYLPPGDWIVRLVIGADDGSAGTYDVHVSWNGDEPVPRQRSIRC